MRIVKGSEAITVEHPIFLIYAGPGLGKTSLGQSAKNPLTLDFDMGVHRAIGRKDAAPINDWRDVDGMEEDIKGYDTIVTDTVGQCLDKMGLDIIRGDSKMAQGGGGLSQRGFGALKARFATWMTKMRTQGKDVLLIAHAKEERNGDDLIIRPDIVGGSYATVMRLADFVGYIYMHGNERVLAFSPSGAWVGKNPAGWSPMAVPPPEKLDGFMDRLIRMGQDALGKISEDNNKVLREIDEWRKKFEGYTKAAQFNESRAVVKALNDRLAPTVAKLLLDTAETKKIGFNREKREFFDPQPATTPMTAPAADLGI